MRYLPEVLSKCYATYRVKATIHRLIRLAQIGVFMSVIPASIVSANTGFGPAGLANQIDADISNFLVEEDIVGMTVAVTQNGRLVYSKGFGRSRRSQDSGGGIYAMQPDMRTRNGSVHKATISGPATYQAMLAAGYDPQTKKVYGSNGILGNKYSTYQRVSTDRFKPIVTMAIAPDDRIYTWHYNGTVSIGHSENLTAYQNPRSFTVADGKEIADLHAIAIAPNNHVYAYYKDGTMSIGTTRDLDARRAIPVNENGDPTEFVDMPIGSDGDRKSMLDVIGIGITKSDSHVVIWYDDLTLSSGTSLDFDYYYKNRTYTSPVVNGADLRYRIRGMGIASNDWVYAWASDDKAFAGWSQDLSSRRAPYSYQHAFNTHYPNQFRDITVQHLFDHCSGFSRSGDVEAARRTFPAYGEPDYDRIHKHFLTTRPLKFTPGTDCSYSNHGMGLTTLLIEALTGKSYREYTVNDYLRPMQLKRKVRPQKVNTDAYDSFAYDRTSNGHVLLPFKDSTTGLAAGGWTSSAQGILGITTQLADRWGYDTLDKIGFFRKASGKLWHNGATGGGYAFLSIFPDDYVSASGRDLREIHVAIASNTGNLKEDIGDRMSSLIGQIANATADANLPTSVDYWSEAWD